MNGFVFDIEANGLFLEANELWTLVAKDLNDSKKVLRLNPFIIGKEETNRLFKEWVLSYNNPIVSGHFILGYDLPTLLKLVGIDFSVGPDTICGEACTYIDTLYLSMYLNPDRKRHSLESYGLEEGLEKIDLYDVLLKDGLLNKGDKEGSEFSFHSPQMDVYCERDVDLNIKVFHRLFNLFKEIYNVSELPLPTHFKCGQKSFFLQNCQSFTGWYFDQDLAREVVRSLEKDSKDLEDEVLPQLPKRKMKLSEEKDYTIPSKPYKADGSLSVTMERFIKKHNAVFIKGETEWELDEIVIDGVRYTVEPKKVLYREFPMELGDNKELKDWFLELGWVPSEYNHKKDASGKPIVDDRGGWIKTSPKLKDGTKICPNLLKLKGELPSKVVKWLSLRNRLGVLNGWLNNERLAYDGRLPAGSTAITPTHRQKHSVVVNVPKASASVLYGKEFRSLFSAAPGKILAAADAKGLESRVEGHYTFKYDGGLRAKELLEGDIHSKMAKVFYPIETASFDITAKDFNKEDPGFSPFRSLTKNGEYALLYGCKPKKLAATLGKPASEADKLFNDFWLSNPSLAKLKENLEKYWATTGKGKFISGIDGRRLYSRKKSSLINLLFQSCGAIAMDYALCFFDSKMGGIKWDDEWKPFYLYKGHEVRRVGYHHDEATFETDPEIGEEIASLFSDCIAKAGQYLKLNVPLEGDWKVGKNWKEIH